MDLIYSLDIHLSIYILLPIGASFVVAFFKQILVVSLQP
jgi:hypothetical protein